MSNNVLPDPLNVKIVEPLEITDRGGTGLPVFLQDQTTDMLDLLFLEEKATGLSLAVDTVIGNRTLTLAASHGLTTANSAGHILEISNDLNNRFYQGAIISIAGDIVTVAPPISNAFTVADSTVGTGNPNMAQDAATGAAIDGSITPVIFTVKPLPTQSGDITRITMATTSPNESDLTTFGGAPGLAIGLLLRYKRQDGTFKNIYNYRKNFDVILHGFDSGTFTPKGGNTVNGFACRISFAGQDKHGVAVRLDGARNEELQIIISELMDNTASGNLSVSFNAEGSELQE